MCFTNPNMSLENPMVSIAFPLFFPWFPVVKLGPSMVSAGPRRLPGRQGHFLRTGSGLKLEESSHPGDRFFQMIKFGE